MQRAARVLHVLFVRVALVLAADRRRLGLLEWECPAGSIAGSHGVAGNSHLCIEFLI